MKNKPGRKYPDPFKGDRAGLFNLEALIFGSPGKNKGPGNRYRNPSSFNDAFLIEILLVKSLMSGEFNPDHFLA